MKRNLIAILPVIFSFASILHGQTKHFVPKQSLGGTFFLLYQIDNDLSRFEVKRAYFTYKANPKKNINIRFTSDVVRTTSGLNLRLKYAYIKWTADTNNLYIEAGLAHRTWLSFEEKLNKYRVLGYMFIEKMNIINSTDLGIKIGGKLGKNLNGHRYKGGKYGDWAIGIYNGGGYSAAETNKNKVIEARLTMRLMPESIPNFLITTAGAYGKNTLPDFTEGNTDFWYSTVMISYDSKPLILNTQVITGIGGYNTINYYLSETVIPYRYYGASIFYDLKLNKFHQFSRFDYLKLNKKNQLIAYSGIAYELNEVVFLVSSYERYLTTNKYLIQIGAKINF